jgi:hypothetical protein
LVGVAPDEAGVGVSSAGFLSCLYVFADRPAVLTRWRCAAEARLRRGWEGRRRKEMALLLRTALERRVALIVSAMVELS